jgi:L-amino acid N-acyltransferase YncA
MMTQIRLATPDDAAGILEIYAPYIENTSFTFETEVPSLEDFQQRIANYLINWPWLVCELDGMIAGYAYGAKYRERTAYQWCVESSIYIHDNFLKHKIGKALYESLMEILKRQGYRNVYAVINLPNDRSVQFHENCGFTYFATYEKVGYKLGKWKNVGWWQLIINEYTMEPEAPIKFSELNRNFLENLFEEKSKMISR